jgi:hypothetical protein
MPREPARLALSQTRARFDATRWPLLELRYPPTLSPDEIAALYGAWESFFVRGEHAVLVDMREFDPFAGGAAVRKRVAEEVEKRRDAFERLLIAEVRVITSPLVRGVVTAFDWIVGSTFSRPVQNVATIAEAEAFLAEAMRRRGLGPRSR